jgi:hypothetical protein
MQTNSVVVKEILALKSHFSFQIPGKLQALNKSKTNLFQEVAVEKTCCWHRNIC